MIEVFSLIDKCLIAHYFAVIINKDVKEMHRVVNALPKEYRVPFAMHVSGFKYREIAEKLNLPLGTVKSRIFFTRQKETRSFCPIPIDTY